MESLVEVWTFSYRHEAEHAKSLLDAENIPSMISADDAGGMRPHLSFGMGGARLMVRKEDLGKAKEVISQITDNNDQSSL